MKEEEFNNYCAHLLRESKKKTYRIFQKKVSSVFKFYNALSTFASRPELVIPNVRSTDFCFGSLSKADLAAYNPRNFNSPFDYFYSQIYLMGRSFASLHVAELSGTLQEGTIKEWISPENEKKTVMFKRFIHHKRVFKDPKKGTVVATETWDFKNHTVVICFDDEYSQNKDGYYFPTIKAKYSEEKSLCKITLEQFCSKIYAYDTRYYEKTVIPKLFEWMSDDYKPNQQRLTRQRARPLSYVSNVHYWGHYDYIKDSTAKLIKAIWKESTDPVKFIHEDIGIASYIAAVMQECFYSVFLPTVDSVDILDFGCGNGLLCFFLDQLVYRMWMNTSVTGFDIRKRQIWKDLLMFSGSGGGGVKKEQITFQQAPNASFPMGNVRISKLDLQERTILPHEIDDLIQLFGCVPQSRSKRGLWIIGNHSDELTPWIPVIARRMNATGFFLIPCCPFDFFTKYQRRANLPGSTTYQNYVEYICTIGDKFGYHPTLDHLRIPSTKKICVVGVDCSRRYKPGVLEARVDEVMEQLKQGDAGRSLAKFIPRSSDDFTKGSQNVNRASAKTIVDKIFKMLIRDCDNAPLSFDWYPGRFDLTFAEIMSVLTSEDRDALKNKGNGLKTLIKSNRHLFVIEKNFVKLRKPDSKDIENVSESSRDKIKTQPCYFHLSHPHGCPLSANLCTYKH